MSDWLVTFESHDGAGTLYMNTICIHNAAPVEEGSTAEIADHIHDWLAAPYYGMLDSTLHVDLMRIASAPAADHTEEIRSVNHAGGLESGGSLPKELAAILSWKTSEASKSGHGHIAIPVPPNAAMYTGGLFLTSTGFWSAVASFASTLLAGQDWTHDLADQHLSLRVWSRKHQESYDVTAAVQRTYPRWVERRQSAP